MRIGLMLFSLSALTACPGLNHGYPPPPLPSPPHRGTISPINGTLTVHTELSGTRVLLGDGSVFNAVSGSSREVTFTDPSLVGPQTVTIIWPDFLGNGTITVDTYVDVNSTDIWRPGVPGPEDLRMNYSGNVLEAPAGSTAQLQFGPAFVSNYARGGVDQTTGHFTQTGDLATWATEIGWFGRAIDSTGAPLRVGALSIAPLPVDQSGLQVDLDQPVDQSVAVSVTNGPTTNNVSLGAMFPNGLGGIVSSASTDTGSAVLQAPSLAGSLATATLFVGAGAADGPDAYRSSGVALSPGQSSVTVDLPDPVEITSPVLNGAAQSLSGTTYVWSQVPGAGVVHLSMNEPDSRYTWTVILPGTRTSFTPFQFVTGLTPNPAMQPGYYRVGVDVSRLNGASSYEDHFSGKGYDGPDFEVMKYGFVTLN